MSKVVRLTLASHAMTDAMAAARFPADEPLNARGRRQVDRAIGFGATEFITVSGPEQRCLQTAELLGLSATVEPRLADLDCGRWRGEVLSDVRPADLASWLTDPSSAPHGGESIVDLMDRVGDWLKAVTVSRLRIVAVTHPAVIRVAILLALEAPAKSFWRMDIAPGSRTELHFRSHVWTLHSL
jgi:broad specificity phosphatase PhoE